MRQGHKSRFCKFIKKNLDVMGTNKERQIQTDKSINWSINKKEII
jgi:hypothetical protein